MEKVARNEYPMSKSLLNHVPCMTSSSVHGTQLPATNLERRPRPMWEEGGRLRCSGAGIEEKGFKSSADRATDERPESFYASYFEKVSYISELAAAGAVLSRIRKHAD